MKELIRTAPDPLKLQVVARGIYILFMSIVVIAMSLLTRELMVITAGVCILIGVGASLISLLNIIKKEAYLVIEGSCTDYTTTGLRRRVKSITISSPDGVIEVRPKEAVKARKDCMVRVYLRNNARIYTDKNKRIVLDYLAIETNI